MDFALLNHVLTVSAAGTLASLGQTLLRPVLNSYNRFCIVTLLHFYLQDLLDRGCITN